MKTTLYSLLTIAFVLSTFAAKAVSTPPTDGLGPKITITVELGKKSKDCERMGVCHVNFALYNVSGINGENTARASAWIENGKLKMEFDRASMTESTFQTHFGSGKFQLEEDFDLPSDVANSLGVKSYTIKTGYYPIPQATIGSSAVLVTF